MNAIKNIIIFLALLIPLNLEAKLEINVLKDNLAIKPGASSTFTINTAIPANLGVFVIAAGSCDMPCISIKQLNNPAASEFEFQSNAQIEYAPHEGKVEIEFGNLSGKNVAIRIQQYVTICDAEACNLLNKMGIKDPLDFRSNSGEYKQVTIASIDSIKTGKDGSWSDVRGQTVFGDPFDVTFIWWLYDPKNEISCGQGSYIERYKQNMLKGGGPALVSGKLAHLNRPVFVSIDTCTGRAMKRPKSANDL